MRVKLFDTSDGRTLPRYPVGRLVGHAEGPVPLVVFNGASLFDVRRQESKKAGWRRVVVDDDSILALGQKTVSTSIFSFIGDGKYCLTAGNDRAVRLWNPSRLDPAFTATPVPDILDIPASHLPRALPIQMYQMRHVATALAVDSLSKYIVVGLEKAALQIDAITAKTIRQWHGHTATIQSVDVISSENRGVELVATASYDATVCLWDGRTNSQKPIQSLKDAKDSVSVVKLTQGSSIVTASIDGCIRTYDVRNGQIITENVNSPITDVAFSSLGARRALNCLDGGLRLIQSDGVSTCSDPLTCRDFHKAGRFGLKCCFAANDSLICTGSEDGKVVFYDSYQATPVCEFTGHAAPTCSVASFGDVVVSASYDGNCIVWADKIDHMTWNDG